MADSSAPRTVVGNLDCEADYAVAAHRRDHPIGKHPPVERPTVKRPTIKRQALAVASAAASLLRVFARSDDDRLVVPLPFDRARMPLDLPLPRPHVVDFEAVRDARDAGAIALAWAAASGDAGAARAADEDSKAAEPLHSGAWLWPQPSFDAAVRVNDRRVTFDRAHALGVALPRTRIVVREDEAHAAIRSIDGPWVAKAPFAAAGRWRVRGDGPLDGSLEDPSSERVRQALAGLLRRHGAVIVEPWCRRTLDVGVVGLVSGPDVRILGAHRLCVDDVGRFQGIETMGRFVGLDTLTWLHETERQALDSTVTAMGRALASDGYSGPFGIDAWRYEDDSGSRFHPLGEVNGRMTFGLVARALIDRLRAPLGFAGDESVALRFGRGSVPTGGIALLTADASDATCAWLEQGDA